MGTLPLRLPQGRPLLGAAALLALATAALGEGALVSWNYFTRYKIYAQPSWDSHGLPAALRLVHQISPPDEQVVLSASINNAFLFLLFFEQTDFRNLDPSQPEYSGLLPPKFLVAGPRSPSPTSSQVLWLLRAEEIPLYPPGKVVGEIPYSD